MKLYLSSYKIGDFGQKLVEMIGAGSKIALIPNALDFATDLERKERSNRADLDSLVELGLKPEVLNLRDYFDKQNELEAVLKQYKAVWVRGGNVFVLREAMRRSGFDQILVLKKLPDEFVYAGYSSGACVLSPSLNVYKFVDDVNQVETTYGTKVIWDGIGLLDFVFEPHYKSDHPEAVHKDKEIEYLVDNRILFKAFRDGEVLIQE